MRRRVTALLAIGIVAGAGLLSATPAVADDVAVEAALSLGASVSAQEGVLPLDGFEDLVVDEAHDQVFISQGKGSLLVTDLAGRPKWTLDTVEYTDDLALSDDGTTLYAALRRDAAIAAIDTASLEVTSFLTGHMKCPRSLAVTEGNVWFSYSCKLPQHSLAMLNPRTGTVTPALAPTIHDPVFTTSPALPGRIAFGEWNQSPKTVGILTVTAGDQPSAVVTASRSGVSSSGDLAITTDGSRLLTQGGEAFGLPDLTPAARLWRERAWVYAFDRRSDGLLALSSKNRLALQQEGTPTPWRVYHFPPPYRQPLEVAWGSRDAYLIVGEDKLTRFEYGLRIVRPRLASNLAVSSDRTAYAFGDRAKMSVRLSGGPPHSVVSLYQTTVGEPRRLVARARVDARGRMVARVAVRASSTFTATYAGSSTIDSARDSVAVEVGAHVDARMTRFRSRDGKYALYADGETMWTFAKVSPNHAGDCLRFYVQFRIRGRWGHDAATKCVRMSRSSSASAYLVGDPDLVGVGIRARAVWHGDRQNSFSASDWQYARFVR